MHSCASDMCLWYFFIIDLYSGMSFMACIMSFTLARPTVVACSAAWPACSCSCLELLEALSDGWP